MIYNLSKEIPKAKASKYFTKLIESGKMIELKEIKPVRSNQQNRYLHLILNYFCIETGYILEEAKQEIFKRVNNNKDIFLRLGKEKWYYRSTANLDTKELTQAIDNFREYSEHFAGVRLPLPNEQGFLMEIQELMELEKWKD